MNYGKLYTRVNSNEHFHAIKLKELLVDNENKKEKKIMMRGKDANGRRERKRITNSYTLLIIVN